MQLSAQMCRTQEAHQLALASAASLINIRTIALAAAAAWNKEAIHADRREERKTAARLIGLSGDERGFSENPDRGFAHA